MNKYLPTFLLLLVLFGANAQYKITGKVITADTKKPVPSASVFFSNTSKGTVTNEAGEFVLDNIPSGRYDMVISCISYETQVQTIQPEKINNIIVVELKPKANELQEVVVGSFVKEGWEQWGKFFTEKFIGTSHYADDCKILNPEVIQFRNYKKQRTLKAFGNETLEIENKALGYKLHYQLELFEFDFKTNLLSYQGYPLFEEMETKRDGLKKRWAKKRQDVYYGSLLHFMRSLYRNQIVEEGFEIRKLVKEPNVEKQRVKALYRKQIITNKVAEKSISIGFANVSSNQDSVAYYEKVMRQKDEKDIVYPALLLGDSIAYAVDSITAGLDFTNYLCITYTKSKELPEYLQQTMQGDRQPMAPVSVLTLINKKPVNIISNGVYYQALDLLNSGYWGWSEKIATMLPFDYWPNKR